MALVAAVVTVVATALLVVAERHRSWYRGPTKLTASTGFIVVAVASGGIDTVFGRLILVGLTLSWIGDTALLGTARTWFLTGLVAFLAGHVAYAAAFLERGLDSTWGAVVGAAASVAAVVVARRLMPHVERPMRAPVVAYILVITAMVILAAGTTGYDMDLRILVGAGAFYVSDLFVARERFVTPGWSNRAWGLPLYYGGQLLLAWSAGG